MKSETDDQIVIGEFIERKIIQKEFRNGFQCQRDREKFLNKIFHFIWNNENEFNLFSANVSSQDQDFKDYFSRCKKAKQIFLEKIQENGNTKPPDESVLEEIFFKILIHQQIFDCKELQNKLRENGLEFADFQDFIRQLDQLIEKEEPIQRGFKQLAKQIVEENFSQFDSLRKENKQRILEILDQRNFAYEQIRDKLCEICKILSQNQFMIFSPSIKLKQAQQKFYKIQGYRAQKSSPSIEEQTNFLQRPEKFSPQRRINVLCSENMRRSNHQNVQLSKSTLSTPNRNAQNQSQYFISNRMNKMKAQEILSMIVAIQTQLKGIRKVLGNSKVSCLQILLRELEVSLLKQETDQVNRICWQLKQMINKYEPNSNALQLLQKITFNKAKMLRSLIEHVNLQQISTSKNRLLKLSMQCADQNGIILVGITGVGKTTLFHGILESKLTFISSNKGFQPVDSQMAQKYKIGGVVLSETSECKCCINPKKVLEQSQLTNLRN